MSLDSKAGPSADSERTLGQLVAQVTQDISTILRKEIELAKAEITGSLKFAAKGIPMLILAGVLSLYALGLLFMAGAWGLHALGLPPWAGFLIMAGLLLLIAAVLALVGKNALAKVKPKPDRAMASAEQTITALKGAVSSGSEHAGQLPAANSQVSLDKGARHR